MSSTSVDSSTTRFPLLVAGSVLVLVLLVNLPGFLCMGLDFDVFAFDLYLRGIQEGKVLYKDMTENNLPGVIFIHWVTRELFGWSSVAIRAIDLLIVGSSILLLTGWTQGISIPSRIWMVTFLFTFYFSISELNHCERDPWMMLPLLVALYLRRTQVEKGSERKRTSWGVFGWGNIEGFIWGCGVWLKPYIVVPALLVWIVSLIAWRRKGGIWKTMGIDLLGLLMGAILCGSMGVGWMMSVGSWQPYLEHLVRNGNDYLSADFYPYLAKWEPLFYVFTRLYPWALMGIGALPFMILFLTRWCVIPNPKNQSSESISQALFVAASLGFFLEAILFQHAFDYVLIPFLFCSLAWIGSYVATTSVPREKILLGILCFVFTFLNHGPVLKMRLSCWSDCVLQGPTPEIQDRLHIVDRVQYRDLEKVKQFLTEQGIQQGELTVFHESGLPLFEWLGIRPPTRTYMMTNQLLSFPNRRDEICQELSQGKQRFVVMNTVFRNMDPRSYDVLPSRYPEPLPEFWKSPYDWTQYVVFRSGYYVVLEMPGNRMRDWIRSCLGL